MRNVLARISIKMPRVRIGNEDFERLLLAHEKQKEAQAVQGMWQAYGQMRAARTIASATLCAGMMAAFGYYFSNYFLDQKKRELEKETERLRLVRQLNDSSFLASNRRCEIMDQQFTKLVEELPAISNASVRSEPTEINFFNLKNFKKNFEEQLANDSKIKEYSAERAALKGELKLRFG